jgi:hypothetical protein
MQMTLLLLRLTNFYQKEFLINVRIIFVNNCIPILIFVYTVSRLQKKYP